jgi:2-polyprenyl-3-methyl-5-hydroxy-6-metoxy-1,4-benzoquinol methylase
MLKDWQDAFGHEIHDYFRGEDGYEIIERDDGFFSVSTGPKLYFLEHEDWPESEKEAMKYVRGRVLDVGCGAGRHSLYLQEQGFDIVGIDNSPLAIKVCRARGLRSAQLLSVTRITRKLGVFDTILMLGNNFALVGNAKRARWLLRRFHRMTSEAGRIIAQTRDPYQTELPEHLEYHARNRDKGRMSGEAKIRVRYKRYVTPWIHFLMVSKEEMKTILKGTNWEVRKFIDGQQGIYTAIIEKESP